MEKRLEKPMFVQVAVDQPLDSLYTYSVPARYRKIVGVGNRVSVPLGRGNKPTMGTVMELLSELPPKLEKLAEEKPVEVEGELFEEEIPETKIAGIKEILAVVEGVERIPADLLELAKWISAYYCAPIGMTLATMVPAAVKKAIRMPTRMLVRLADTVTPVEEQLAKVRVSAKTRRVFEGLFEFLSGGVKTELKVMEFAKIGRILVKRLVTLGLLASEREIKLPEAAVVGADISTAGRVEKLSDDQERALKGLVPLVEKGGFSVRLLHGVTGSGKTELYIRAIEKVVAAGKRAIVLVPEISLTPQTVRRFTARFPRVAILHSGLKDSERHQHWHAIAAGWPQVIVGARSAIFAPVKDLGLIVVDEEHDPSYKQDNIPKYHGRDVAIRRAQMLNVPIVLGSATPALESWHNAHRGGGESPWGLLSLPSRPMGMQMPRVVTVDMKAEQKLRRGLHILSTILEHHLKQTLEQKKQTILLLNRRGYAHYIMCPRCDWVLMCDNCDATMVVHRQKAEGEAPPSSGPAGGLRGKVLCHYCLTAQRLPERCPLCQARLTHLGQGTQRAEDELLRKFPSLRLARMDSDSMTSGDKYQQTLDAFGRGELDLLIGTQMISKGLDFPNVRLVGVLNADLAMTMPDFRASERTFQLICQVAGRSGRAMGGGIAERGTVVVQTFQPQEPAIVHACNHDYQGFVHSELPHRRELAYPPYGRVVRIVLSHKGYETVHTQAEALKRLIDALIEKMGLAIHVKGPLPPAMGRLMEMYRSEILMFAGNAGVLQQVLAALRARGALAMQQSGIANPKHVAVSVDVDPLHML